MLGSSPAMDAVRQEILRVFDTDITVFIRGESGTGKELVARSIHAAGLRSNRPFVALNCGAIPETLQESVLFGHDKGAFTGATDARAGTFETADGGTLLLDEVAELPLAIQARLLRVLQERTFVPVGGVTPKEVDIRVLAATHKSLRQAVEERSFREDLMYRIRVVPVFIPPLAERGDDIAALAWRFVAAFNRNADRTITGFTPEAYDMLKTYAWPGNIRELRNVIEYAFAVGTGATVSADELPPELRGELPTHRLRDTGGDGSDGDDDERNTIRAALAAAGGQKSRAAEHLGISRTTLWRRIRELKLSDT